MWLIIVCERTCYQTTDNYFFTAIGCILSLLAKSFWKKKIFLERWLLFFIIIIIILLLIFVQALHTYRERDLILVIWYPSQLFTKINMNSLGVTGHHYRMFTLCLWKKIMSNCSCKRSCECVCWYRNQIFF